MSDLAQRARQFYQDWTRNQGWPEMRPETERVKTIYDFAAAFARAELEAAAQMIKNSTDVISTKAAARMIRERQR